MTLLRLAPLILAALLCGCAQQPRLARQQAPIRVLPPIHVSPPAHRAQRSTPHPAVRVPPPARVVAPEPKPTSKAWWDRESQRLKKYMNICRGCN